ncbi:nucleotidyltransferase [Methylocystis sp. SB2]|uniref:nucleotidyltransferase domain-containing protein n=1 Tax=Methylocystis sp. (strain SB2) TaxID=743836 RepID=UPI0004A389EE|nr:nucleotidyltransferase [Methylocystis sp. SB2]
MTIPEFQLERWSHLGAVTTSKDTYATIKRALESPDAGYSGRSYKVFLQGSYGNDTNIYSESDVDIVICCADAFYYDLDHLSLEHKGAFNANRVSATYAYATFKADVQAALVAAFGSSVQVANKAFKIAAAGNRRSADVVAAFEHRRYIEFKNAISQSFYEGISFFTTDGRRINNFPNYHSNNLTAKHQATGNRFKPAVRIFKNIRSKATEIGLLEKGDAPSYFIEGLLYNVPNEKFISGFSDTTLGILSWLYENADRTQFVCANERYYLLRDNDSVCWPRAKGTKFINAAITLWNEWQDQSRTRFI